MKQLKKTPHIEALLRKSVGPDADLSKVAVFEATLLNTLPIRKRHPLFAGAIPRPSVLRGIMDAVLEESHPVHLNHESYDMNKGRLFHAEIMPGPELRGLFFLQDDERSVELVNSGVVDQVSVSFIAEHAFCSQCSFDYYGKESSFEHIYSGTCANDHKIGENGCHAELEGLAQFNELSLVDMGGAKGARIHGPSQAQLSQTSQTLAASIGIEATALILSTSPVAPKQIDPKTHVSEELDMTDFTAQLGTLTSQIADLTIESKQATADLALRTTELATANAALTAMTTERDDLQTQLDTATTNLTAATDAAKGAPEALAVLTDLAKQVAKLSGVDEDKVPADLTELSAFLVEHKTKLAGSIVVGGKSNAAGDDKDADRSTALSATAFKSARKRQ